MTDKHMDIFDDFHKCVREHYADWLLYIQWLCNDQTEFIREIAFDFRRITRSPKQICDQLLYFCDPRGRFVQGHGQPNVWLSVYNFTEETKTHRPLPDYSTAVIDRALFDFDVSRCTACMRDPGICGFEIDPNGKCEGYVDLPQIPEKELRKPYEEAMTLQEQGSLVIFTGRKGFQAHSAERNLKTGQDLRRLQERVEELWGFETVDHSVYGDVTRVCRLAHSCHPISGLCCVIVKPSESLESVLERSRKVHIPRIPCQ